jgi:sugar O-acyltransferase (sialic acid O-acetyltransferase NeuD family)
MTQKKLIVIGAGQTIDELYPIIQNLKNGKNYKLYKILDDDKKFFKKNYKGIPIQIGISNARKYKDCHFIFGIGSYKNKNERAKILKKTELSKNFFPNIIHKNTIIENNVKIGFGNIIYPFSVVCSGSHIENFCVITHSGIIAHNVQLGSYSLLGSRTSILNNAKIGKEVFFGANVVIGEKINIGNKARILFGSVVIKNVKARTTIFGNPGIEIAK